MKTLIRMFVLSTLTFLFSTVTATAEPATLVWDQNTQPEVIGYKVYYQVDSPTFPFNGTTLSEGASPIIINDPTNTSLTIDLPNDGNIYYFTATAFSDSGLESTFSEIIASEWIPYLIEPIDLASVGSAVTFTWDLPPTDYYVTYDLYYGTDPNFNAIASPVASFGPKISGWPQIELSTTFVLSALLTLTLLIQSGLTIRVRRSVRTGVVIGLFALQVSCGGGADSGSTPVNSTPELPAPTPTEPLFTNVVTGISNTDYLVTNLQPESQYYWKIVAVDDQGFPYESLSQTFTTY